MQSCYCDLRRSQRVEQLCVEWQAIEKCGETFLAKHTRTDENQNLLTKVYPILFVGQSSSSLSAIRVETRPSGIASDSVVPWDVYIQRYPFTLCSHPVNHIHRSASPLAIDLPKRDKIAGKSNMRIWKWKLDFVRINVDRWRKEGRASRQLDIYVSNKCSVDLQIYGLPLLIFVWFSVAFSFFESFCSSFCVNVRTGTDEQSNWLLF